MSALRVLAIIGNAIMVVIYAYIFIDGRLNQTLTFIYMGLSIIPVISLIYLYKTRFIGFSSTGKPRPEKQKGLLGLWLHRKKMEEQAKIDKLKGE
ncbi:hypothetical protein LR61_07645 [Morganella morganii]|nr:hypothetical protein LR61_07645 [Morganella morganii]